MELFVTNEPYFRSKGVFINPFIFIGTFTTTDNIKSVKFYIKRYFVANPSTYAFQEVTLKGYNIVLQNRFMLPVISLSSFRYFLGHYKGFMFHLDSSSQIIWDSAIKNCKIRRIKKNISLFNKYNEEQTYLLRQFINFEFKDLLTLNNNGNKNTNENIIATFPMKESDISKLVHKKNRGY